MGEGFATIVMVIVISFITTSLHILHRLVLFAHRAFLAARMTIAKN